MMNGNINEFINHLYYADGLTILYKDTEYLIEGYLENNIYHLYLQDNNKCKKIWEKQDVDRKKVVDAFLNDRIFDGNTFYEISSKIKWTD